jgi:pSer/pThr/pTyr-binding forkhead associated (FHA) protein
MRLSLQVPYGAGMDRKLMLGPGEVERIGRASELDKFSVKDPFMSRAHFELRCGREGKCVIRDLESSHGTYLNGEKVVEAELSDGDKVFAGRTPFVVRLDH